MWTKIFKILLFVSLYGLIIGLEALQASNPTSAIIVPKKVAIKDNASTSFKVGLTQYGNFNNINFTLSAPPLGLNTSIELNSALEQYYTVKQTRNTSISLIKKSGLNPPYNEKYLIEITFENFSSITVEQEYQITVTLSDNDYTSTQDSCEVYLISKKYIGDADGDGYVDISDINLVRDCIIEKNNSQDIKIHRADVDGNGKINVNDIINIFAIMNSQNYW